MRQLYFDKLYDKYTECSVLEPTTSEITVKDSSLSLDATLEAHNVVFYEITLAE